MNRKIYLNKVSLKEAREKYFDLFKEKIVSGEKTKVSVARGRVTAEAVYARRSAPHYYASAMDGIAVRAADTAGASQRQPVKLKTGEEAHLLDTGEPLPEEFNAVIKIEEVNEKEGYYEIEKGATPWQNVRNIGESVIKGELILPVNHKLTAYDLGVLQEAGITEIRVRKKPVVGIIPTGSELVPPAKKPGKGELTEFNSTILSAYAGEWGADAHSTGIVNDDYNQILDKFMKEHKDNDLTILIAGSSAGEEDYTVEILQELGEIIVHGVNIMPGKPVILARVDDKPVIGLPGYPVAAVLNYYIFVRVLIFMMLGLEVPSVPKAEVEVKKKIPSQIGLKEFLRVNLAQMGQKLIAVPRKRGSAAMKSLLKADGIMPISRQKEGLSPGSRASVYLMKCPEKIKRNLLYIGSHDLSLDILVNMLARKRANFELNIQSAGSQAGLVALKRGEAHLTGAHLLDKESGEYNVSYVKRLMPDRNMALINFVYRRQGLFVKAGNPKGIESITDLTRDDIVYINRQRGAGTRILLDYWLEEKDISLLDISGYDREEYTHINAAAAVAAGSADTALGIRAAAEAMELDFIPLLEERYDLILPLEMIADRRIQLIIDYISTDNFKDRVQELGGYRTDNSGQIREIRGDSK